MKKNTNFTKKKVIIIGSDGYIGKHFSWFLKQNYGIVPYNYDFANKEELNYYKIDITDKDSVKNISLDADYIFIFAGLTGTYTGFDNYEKFIEVNELGLLNLLDAIRNSKFRPKVIYPSTRLVYKGFDKPLKEEDEKEAKTIYAVNKLASEYILQAYKESFDIPYTIFRICIPYGNLLSSDYSFGTVGFFIKQAKAGKDITLYGDGIFKRTFTHMEDLCYQIIEGAFHEESNGEIYNVGGEILSLKEAAEIIAAQYGVKVVSVPWPEKDLRIESRHTFFDDTKIQSLLHIKHYRRLKDFSKDI